jgi:hypothetical protein
MVDVLNRIYAAVDHIRDLDGQDQTLVLDMSQAMLDDVINGGELAPMIDYVTRYCDVYDSPAHARQIADDI